MKPTYPPVMSVTHLSDVAPRPEQPGPQQVGKGSMSGTSLRLATTMRERWARIYEVLAGLWPAASPRRALEQGVGGDLAVDVADDEPSPPCPPHDRYQLSQLMTYRG
jgi:hypothetical protein